MSISESAFQVAVAISQRCIREGREPSPADAALLPPLLPLPPDQVLNSVHRGQVQRHIAHMLPQYRGRAYRQQFVASYASGTPIVEIAAACRFSPYLIARILLEELCGASGRKEVSSLVREPHLIEDDRLRAELSACIAVDVHVSPLVDVLRARIGDVHEALLYAALRARGIPFTSEEGLRGIGAAKTPDALLGAPLGLLAPDGTPRVVNWVDSKAAFGDPDSHRQNLRQFESYVNRFGSGLVIYFYGYVASITAFTPPDVLVLHSLPGLWTLPGREGALCHGAEVTAIPAHVVAEQLARERAG